MPDSPSDQFKKLLNGLGPLSPEELKEIITTFQQFKKVNTLKPKELDLTHLEMMGFVVHMYFDFECLRKLQDKCRNYHQRNALNAALIGYFYEMISTIQRFDVFGYCNAGFNLTDEDIKRLKKSRNMKFHIPDDMELFLKRADSVLEWEDMVQKNVPKFISAK